jgi:hypothetical protein
MVTLLLEDTVGACDHAIGRLHMRRPVQAPELCDHCGLSMSGPLAVVTIDEARIDDHLKLQRPRDRARGFRCALQRTAHDAAGMQSRDRGCQRCGFFSPYVIERGVESATLPSVGVQRGSGVPHQNDASNSVHVHAGVSTPGRWRHASPPDGKSAPIVDVEAIHHGSHPGREQDDVELQ